MTEKITSRENPAVKHAGKLLKSAKYRRQTREFAAEGFRLCRDALLSDVKLRQFFYTEEAFAKYPEEVERFREQAEKSLLISRELMCFLSDTVTPQGILCVCSMLDKTECLDKMDASGHYLALEDIQDPSNLGTVLRTAEALGLQGVLLTKGCCDLYSPKVLRGSMGAVFRLPVYETDSMEQAVETLQKKGFLTLAAVPAPGAKKITEVNFNCPAVVLVGNEGNGLRQETIAACHQQVTIPMPGRAESLNASVAAGLIMWEMVRGRARNHNEP